MSLEECKICRLAKVKCIRLQGKADLFAYFVFYVYLSSLPVANLSDAPRRRLVVTGDSARIYDEPTESCAWSFKVLGVQHTRDLGLKSLPKNI